MNWLDPATMGVTTALVVTVAGAGYMIDVLSFRSSVAARLWAVALMSGILTVLAYLAWTFIEGAWVAAGVGNGAFVATTGFIWVGCRAHNERRLTVAAVAAALAAVGTGVVTLASGVRTDPWAGSAVMFASLAILAALCAIESRRGALSRRPPSWGITVALGLQCLYYLPRTYLFLTQGPDSETFLEWFGTSSTSLLTITFTIVVVVSMLMMRSADRARPAAPVAQALTGDGLVRGDVARQILTSQIKRAHQQGQYMALIALRLDDLSQIRVGFGAHAAKVVRAAWTEAIEAGAPPSALLGQLTDDTRIVAIPVTGKSQAQRLAMALSQRILDQIVAGEVAITPLVGVGVALSRGESEADALVDEATLAANRAADQMDGSVVFAGDP